MSSSAVSSSPSVDTSFQVVRRNSLRGHARTFAIGGSSAALARTLTSPLDRFANFKAKINAKRMKETCVSSQLSEGIEVDLTQVLDAKRSVKPVGRSLPVFTSAVNINFAARAASSGIMGVPTHRVLMGSKGLKPFMLSHYHSNAVVIGPKFQPTALEHENVLSKQSIEKIHRRFVAETGGIRGMWQGNAGASVHKFMFSGCAVMAGTKMRSSAEAHGIDPSISPLATGVFAGAMAALVAYPVEASIKMQKILIANSQNANVSLFRGFVEVTKASGAKGYLKGLSQAMAADVPMAALGIQVYFTAKAYYTGGDRAVCDSAKYPAHIAFTNGALAGAVASATMYPVEQVRKHYHMVKPTTIGSQSSVSTFAAMRQFAKLQGARGLYRGLLAEVACKAAPSAGFTFMFLEMLREALQ